MTLPGRHILRIRTAQLLETSCRTAPTQTIGRGTVKSEDISGVEPLKCDADECIKTLIQPLLNIIKKRQGLHFDH